MTESKLATHRVIHLHGDFGAGRARLPTLVRDNGAHVRITRRKEGSLSARHR